VTISLSEQDKQITTACSDMGSENPPQRVEILLKTLDFSALKTFNHHKSEITVKLTASQNAFCKYNQMNMLYSDRAPSSCAI